MIKIALLDDNEQDLNDLYNCVSRYFEEKNLEIRISKFSSSKDFLECQDVFNVAFLDIEMDGKNGMDVAHTIFSEHPDTFIIFVTNLIQYAVEGYTVDAASYILKPLVYDDFALKMKRVIQKINKGNFIKINDTEKGQHFLDVNNIIYCLIEGHYLSIFYNNGEVYKIRSTMKEAEEKFKNLNFIRVSNYYLVNFNNIKSFKKDDLFLDNGFSIKVTRSYKKQLLNRLERL